MSRCYSLDLRTKVISFISQGGGKREASRVFNIGEDTVYRWIRRDKAGDLSPKKRTNFPRKVPLEVLVKYVSCHPDHTLKEIGLAVNLSISKVWKHLKQLGITLKKRPRSIRKEMKQSVQNL
ncbi:MAG: transposase [Alphaproteobacteria bacterium]|nr:transposase [Alphaproteobacteria bacterium]